LRVGRKHDECLVKEAVERGGGLARLLEQTRVAVVRQSSDEQRLAGRDQLDRVLRDREDLRGRHRLMHLYKLIG
jgi:hypothetical protein